MSFSQWRRFNFFDRELLKDPVTKQELSSLKGLSATCSASGRGQILIGDSNGEFHQLDRDLQVHTSRIYELKVTHLFQLKQHAILVSIGNDEVGINPMIKVWNYNKLDKNGSPTCVRMFRALVATKPVEVSCISVHENLGQMAIGFEDGSVVIVKGDITNARHSKSRILHTDKFPVTGLAYKQFGNNIILFVTTTKSVMSFNLTSKDQKEILEEDFGSRCECSAMNDVVTEYQFVVAASDGVHFYHSEGKRACLAFEGEKKMVCWFRGYLVVVSNEMKQLPRTAGLKVNILSIYDIENRFIAYSAPFPDVIALLPEWSCLHVLTADGQVFQLEEKDTQTKLEMMFKKNMYDLAISLAKSQHYSDGLIEIFRHYGDHLYSKGDHYGAIQQYIRTIGHLEPSYVIRKFLDAQRIHNLTEYLQALHEKGLANTDHTTLLLNCYTKLKSVDKLNGFIHTDKELNFDVETAIKVCRQAGYYTHALQLAEKYNQHEWYLRIQLEDVKDYETALKYMHRLPFEEAENNIKKYGKTLVNNVADDTTKFLMELCTDYQQQNIAATAEAIVTSQEVQRARPVDFIHIFVHKKPNLKQFLQHMVKKRSDCSNVTYNTLLELYLHDSSVAVAEKDFVRSAEEEKRAYDLLTNSESNYDLDHAMILSQMHNFKRGILFLYERTKSFQQILRYHMEHDDYDAVIEDCQKHGNKDLSLWSDALSYFARKEEDCRMHITEVLNHIDKYKLMSPLEVIDVLAKNFKATLSVVKEYIIKQLQAEDEQIAEDETLIRKYKEDTDKMTKQIDELKTSAKIFQSSKCMICSRPLELPAVHFLCGDSFHQTCFESFSENEKECPVCTPENRKVMDIIAAQENNKDLHEQFNQQLERSTDGFSVVADYFGRGVFKKLTVYTDNATSSNHSRHT